MKNLSVLDGFKKFLPQKETKIANTQDALDVCLGAIEGFDQQWKISEDIWQDIRNLFKLLEIKLEGEDGEKKGELNEVEEVLFRQLAPQIKANHHSILTITGLNNPDALQSADIDINTKERARAFTNMESDTVLKLAAVEVLKAQKATKGQKRKAA